MQSSINIINNEELHNAIVGAKKVIIGKDWIRFGSFDGYQKVYFNTNENIKEYLELADLTNKHNALTVTSGGDHTFNLITNGILNIDTFDVNKLTEYFALGLKRAMIIKYNYEEYILALKKINNSTTSFETISSLILDLLPYMDEKYRVFWREILDYYYKTQKSSESKTNLFYLLCISFDTINCIMNNNSYLTDKKSYNILRENISKTNITFSVVDILELPQEYKNNKYDLLFLSNILDYIFIHWGSDWKYNKLKRFLSKIENITQEDGIIFLKYVYLYKYMLPNLTMTTSVDIIKDSSVTIDDLSKLEIHPLSKYNSEDLDGIILKRC